MQTHTYIFVGSACTLGNGAHLQRYGQKVELTDAEAFDYLCHSGAALLPEEDFIALDHSEEELTRYPTLQSQREAPAEFLAKRAAAWRAIAFYRVHLRALPAETPAALTLLPAESDASEADNPTQEKGNVKCLQFIPQAL